MAYTTTRVAYNFTSYTASSTGLYVFTGSRDGGYSVTLGGTATKLYSNNIAAGTVGIFWAESGQTITCSTAQYGQLVRVDGFSSIPSVSLLSQQTTTATTTGQTDTVYIGAITGYSHSAPSSLNYSFACSGASISTVAHPNPSWSRNAMSLIIPSSEATITATCNSNEYKQAYIFKVQVTYDIQTTINPIGSGTVSGDGEHGAGTTASLLATANSGYLFDYWELDGFTRLEYIESTGTQYIDTGLAVSSGMTFKTECLFTTTDGRGTILAQSNSSRYAPWISREFLRPSVSYKTANVNLSINEWHNIEVNDTNAIVDETTYAYTNNTDIVSGGNVWLFRRADGNYYGKGRIKTLSIEQNGAFLRNFIPVKRNSDNEIGLLDLVEMKFYANAGTGVFSYGEELGSITYTDNPLSLVINSDLSLIANFKLNYQITLTYDSTLGNATYDWVSGTQIQLVATPNSNAQFKGWYINSIPISTNATYTYTVLSDVVIEARFERIWDITTNVSGNGSIQFTRVTDQNDVVFSVIADTNNHFVKYVVDGVEYTTTPLTLYLTQDTTITAYFEENERYHITVNSNFPYGSFYISDNDVFAGTIVTIWARPFPDYNFVKWQDGTLENPRQIEVNSDITLVAEYQRSFETNGIYQYRCYVKDQLDLEAPPKAFMRVDNFDIKRDTMTKSNTTIYVMDTATNVNNGDVLVVYDPMGTNLYEGVVKSMEGNKIICSQMPSFYKGLWIYNVSPQDYLEHEIAVLLQAYADGQIYRSSYTDTLVAQRLGGITINYVGSTAVNLPTDLDDNGNEKLTQKDMEQWIYELYENYGIIFDFEINMAGANYVTIKTPSYETIKVGNNMYAIQDMSPITEIEETNRLIIFSSQKVYRTTYVATKNGVVEQPTSTNNRFDITNTKVVFSDDDVDTLIANNLPEQMYNHKLTFTLIIKNFLYEFGDFNLGGEIDVWVNDDYYNTVLTGYQIKKASNQNITEVGFTCGKVRVALTKKLTMGVVL